MKNKYILLLVGLWILSACEESQIPKNRSSLTKNLTQDLPARNDTTKANLQIEEPKAVTCATKERPTNQPTEEPPKISFAPRKFFNVSKEKTRLEEVWRQEKGYPKTGPIPPTPEQIQAYLANFAKTPPTAEKSYIEACNSAKKENPQTHEFRCSQIKQQYFDVLPPRP